MPENESRAPRSPGLRERKKILTRQTIAEAAFSLAREHGLDAVTIDDIAERAFVSPRTVSNYFPSKEAAVVASSSDGPDELLVGLDARPADEEPLLSLRAVIVEAMGAWDDDRLASVREREALIDRFPALLPHRMAQYDALEDAMRRSVAQRAHVDAETETFPRLVAAAAAAAVKTAVRVWVRQDGTTPTLVELVEQAFDELEAGLPEPTED
ncbi:TetR/AcrR family transcriptional regulator [Agrococcus terreus]|uniref:TetR/AcrR family transcriptional regulator n=1 Tax=Agrococcus terreus TaxID=574649 RepID=UPI00384B36E2